MRFVRLAFLAAVATLVLVAPASAKVTASQIKKIYYAASTGSLKPCAYDLTSLQATKKLLPADLDQYAPEIRDTLDGAIEAHTRGDCDKKATPPAGAATTATPTPEPTVTVTATPQATATPAKIKTPTKATATATAVPTATPIPTTTVIEAPPSPPSIAQPKKDDGRVERVADVTQPTNATPAAILWILILTCLLGGLALFLAVSRFTGVGEARLDGVRHSWREAAWRANGAWQDFLDWLRLGR